MESSRIFPETPRTFCVTSKNSMKKTSHVGEAESDFLKAYEEHAENLFRFLIMKVSDKEMAQDLLQETFTRAWDYCVQGGVVQQWKPFLFRTGYNLVVDTYRKKRAVSLDAMIDDHGFAIPVNDDLRNIDRAEVKRIRAAIGSLEEMYRDVLLLRFTEDLPPKIIAEMIGLSENVVSVRINRGLQKLRELISSDQTKKL